MVNDVWKRIGIILSALWLLVAGYFEGLAICFYGEMSRSEYREPSVIRILLANSPNEELMRFTRLNIKSLRG